MSLIRFQRQNHLLYRPTENTLDSVLTGIKGFNTPWFDTLVLSAARPRALSQPPWLFFLKPAPSLINNDWEGHHLIWTKQKKKHEHAAASALNAASHLSHCFSNNPSRQVCLVKHLTLGMWLWMCFSLRAVCWLIMYVFSTCREIQAISQAGDKQFLWPPFWCGCTLLFPV